MSAAQPLLTALGHRLNAIRTRCHRLIQMVCDPYRPELHYMRGPGPACRAKQRDEHL